MNTFERRRSARLVVSREDIALVHDQEREIPARLVDMSQTGALMTLFLPPAVDRGFSKFIELSMHDGPLVLHVKARVVRHSPEFLAVEFADERAGVHERINAKLERLAQAEGKNQKTKAATSGG